MASHEFAKIDADAACLTLINVYDVEPEKQADLVRQRESLRVDRRDGREIMHRRRARVRRRSERIVGAGDNFPQRISEPKRVQVAQRPKMFGGKRQGRRVKSHRTRRKQPP